MIVDLKTPVHPLRYENRGVEDVQFAGFSIPPKEGRQFRGLSKLEYAAIAAMQGLLAGPRISPAWVVDKAEVQALAEYACAIAEAVVTEAVRRETMNGEAGGDGECHDCACGWRQPVEHRCTSCGGQGEVHTGGYTYYGHLDPPEPEMITCPECGGDE